MGDDDDDDDGLDLTLEVQSIPPEHADRLRQRRPGYDRVYELVRHYLEIPPEKRTQISEVDLSTSYLQPMFRALGWTVLTSLHFLEGSSSPIDFGVEYEKLRVLVEVKNPDRGFGLGVDQLQQYSSTWGILTNFERIQILDLERTILIAKSSPFSYVTNDKEEHDLLAAPVFYERVARPREIEPLIAALSEPNESTRQRAIEALGNTGERSAVEPLIRALDDSNESIRQFAVEALGKIGDPRAVEPLITTLSDLNESIRQSAAEALGRIGDSQAVEPLISVLSDPNESIRQAVVRALGQIRDSRAVEALTHVLDSDENASIRQTAAEALEKIGAPSTESLPDTIPEITIAVRALADTPSEVDLLGFSVYAEALADFIRSAKTEKPLTIGIDAAWGMGKTTLMQMIRKHLERKVGGGRKGRSFTTVWFNAWKYDQEESLWAALALEILAQIRQRCNWWQRGRLWWKLNWRRLDRALLIQALLKFVFYVAAIYLLGMVVYGIAAIWLGWDALNRYVQTLGSVGLLGALYATGKDLYDRIAGPFDLKLSEYVRKPNYKERVGFLAEFEEDFKKVIDVVTDGGKWPLVVFIDDLDRCAPPKPAEIIEAINILLDAEHCAFVIGMDSQAVAASIETKYEDLCRYLDDRDDPGGLTLGQRFLEKIVQISFHIPSTDPNTIESFVDTNLGVLARPASDEPPQTEVTEAERLIKAEQKAGKALDEAAQAVAAARPDLRAEAVTEARREIVAQTFDDSVEVRNAIRKAAPYLGYNPRKIKRFINIFRLEAFVANRRGLLESRVIQLSSLAKWVIITLRWPVVIAAMKMDGSFIHELLVAHKVQEELRQTQYRPDEVEAREVLSAELESRLSENARLRRLLDAGDLVELLAGMTSTDRSMFPYYLHLAQTISVQAESDLSSAGHAEAPE